MLKAIAEKNNWVRKLALPLNLHRARPAPHSILPSRSWGWLHSTGYFGLSYEAKHAVDYKVQNAMAFSGKTLYHSLFTDWNHGVRYYFGAMLLFFISAITFVAVGPLKSTPILSAEAIFPAINRVFLKLRSYIFFGAVLAVSLVVASIYLPHHYYFKGQGLKVSYFQDGALTHHFDTKIMPSLDFEWVKNPIPAHKGLFSLRVDGFYHHKSDAPTVDIINDSTGEVTLILGGERLGLKQGLQKVAINKGWTPIKVEYRSSGVTDQKLSVRINDKESPVPSHRLIPRDTDLNHFWPSPKDVASKYYQLDFIKW